MEYRLTHKYDIMINDLIIQETSQSHIMECGVSIGVMASEKEKKKGKKAVFGDCMKVPDKMKDIVPYDFLITIYETNCMMFNEGQMKILLFHELLHIGAENTKDGGVRKFIIPHCIEEFAEIRDRFGIDWNAPGTLMDFMEEENE